MLNNFRSPMTLETVVVLLTGIVAALLAAALLFNWLPGLPRRWLAWAGLALTVVSVVAIAGIYLLPARPAWNTWLLPLTLLASSVANGVLLAWVLAAYVPRAPGEAERAGLVERLRPWALPSLAAYALLAVLFLMVAAGRAGGVERVLAGDLALPFWLGLIVIGLAAPAGLVWLARAGNSASALAAFVLVIAGGVVVRAMLFPLGAGVPLTSLW
jgi:anaerobic dimethyl sulfoxide reductase subunit C (anchor subunit)